MFMSDGYSCKNAKFDLEVNMTNVQVAFIGMIKLIWISHVFPINECNHYFSPNIKVHMFLLTFISDLCDP
jgi:hypothetical protein